MRIFFAWTGEAGRRDTDPGDNDPGDTNPGDTNPGRGGVS